MMSSDLLSLNATANRITQLTREKEEKRTQERRRNLLYLVAAFLGEQGYTNSVDVLSKEAQLSRDIQICDNVDLEIILMEYSDYHYVRFNKYPKLCKKIESIGNTNYLHNTVSKRDRGGCGGGGKVYSRSEDESGAWKNKVPLSKSTMTNGLTIEESNFGITVTPIFPSENVHSKSIVPDFISDNERTLKPIGDLYPSGSEWREIAEVISKEIVLRDLNVHWKDIKGLNKCKMLLKEATVYPIKYPALFNEKLGPWKGVLLYGPPGTGKTMLAKAVATECRATFFNITSSSLISKWRGDSEKYVRVLTDLARFYAPTIIFIDEIDWTTTNNAGDYSSMNSEPARRFRAELLARLDGLLSTENVNVTLLAATNVPWNLDAALLRRLEKRIFVDLPDYGSRLEILRSYVDSNLHVTEEFKSLLRYTEGYSCADLKLLCKEAWMNQLRPILQSLEEKKIAPDDIQSNGLIINVTHLVDAMVFVKPIVKNMKPRYVQWNTNFGSSTCEI
ncbi:katanin p60 ATPase-containing subunit A-like 2 [Polistes fuscatus]|uniref:katanin p60 ATPase-containing subunit A-like 2 n=1 Tax=Polistes fuscatus TaxID=30207 RepID=UPI001CA989E3|nr:katanin p60 ATPase-containing subunit A-like 2 [Polistes fuscatus]